MLPEMEKPRITEIKVRMDCNGCVHKIKKALHGITGIYDLYVDFPQQKITIVGWADPAKIVKAIKKTRKTAIICSHTEQSDEPAAVAPPENGTPEASGEAPPPPPPESTNPPPEQPPAEAAPPAEAQKEPPPPATPPPTQPENPPTEAKLSQESDNDPPSQSSQSSKPREHEEIHVIYHHPPDYGYRYAYGHYVQNDNNRQWNANAYPTGPGFRVEPPQPPQPPQPPHPPQPVYVTHSYNTYRPSPYTTEYAYPQSPPGYSYYSRPDNYNHVYYGGSNGNGNGNGNITSMFGEENPNACTIV
ncbi:Heavy metal-associated isoprenylated plant protein 23 [Sesamum alatum]|uniref:Heavy metal-associated isoprenylated plant protein 23 n=1 Tax=Sesamum alatum TaxID=300844 RepID=A0AAE1YQ32_9LAMI|nr:Heavy metal-associated isoprenylated plant protein 23 [Sesamum alatum]